MSVLSRFRNAATAFISGSNGYDVVEQAGKRKRGSSVLKSEDRVLRPWQRAEAQGSSRMLQRNYSVAAWAIRMHLNYVSTFQLKAQTGNKEFNEELEAWYEQWSRRADRSGRHTLQSMTRLLEARSVVDGDCGWLLFSDGTLRGIESDLVRNPGNAEMPAEIDNTRMVHGVRVSITTGRSLAYALHRRTQYSGYEFDRMVSARNFIWHGFYDRFDQVRGVSPLLAAVGMLQDSYEGFSYALTKLKLSQIFGLAVYREQNLGSDDEDDDYEGWMRLNFDRTATKNFDLYPGDKAEFIESKTPSLEFQQFQEQIIMASLKALDIPMSFYDESHTNYSGARQALLQYQHSAQRRQDAVKQSLSRLLAWRLTMAIRDGELTPPADAQMKWEWIGIGLPWIDPQKETNAFVQQIDNALNSRTQILKSRGMEFEDIVEDLAKENAMLEAAGVRSEQVAQMIEEETEEQPDDE